MIDRYLDDETYRAYVDALERAHIEQAAREKAKTKKAALAAAQKPGCAGRDCRGRACGRKLPRLRPRRRPKQRLWCRTSTQTRLNPLCRSDMGPCAENPLRAASRHRPFPGRS